MKFDHFRCNFRKSLFRRLLKARHRRGKTIKSKEIIFLPKFISGNVHLVPETVKSRVLGHPHCQIELDSTLKSEISIFQGFSLNKFIKEKSLKNRDF